MDIIKYIRPNKKHINLIICDDMKQITFNIKNFLVAIVHISNTIYYAKFFNPPFFNNIICFNEELNHEDIRKIWNMTNTSGYFIIRKKYGSLFEKNIVKKNSEFVMVHKKTNFQYIFYDKYRILEFVIGGTMKGGTTAAAINLTKHPDISMNDEEIHFYDKMIDFQRGFDWYKKHFDYKKKFVGDKAPDIMYMPHTFPLLQSVNPFIKIILFLRNPIHRAHSHWKMMDAHFFKNENVGEKFIGDITFEDYVSRELNFRMNENNTYTVSLWYHFIRRGFYFEQICNMLKYFKRENILILISEKVKENMTEEYNKIYDFLGVRHVNGKYEEAFLSTNKDIIGEDTKLYKILKKVFSKDVQKLEKFLGYKTGWW
jgi:hypothetical protein